MNKLSPKIIALVLYHLIVGTIIAANFHSDIRLMGWDGLYPEFNIPLNLLRGLTAGWQEYYGAGLVGGHGFAATLPHTLIIGLFSLAIPQHLVRSVFIFFCYYLGGLGMLVGSRKLLEMIFDHHESSKLRTYLMTFAGLVSSVYYLTNLAAIQTFYVPLEAFTVHYAAFPWLTYGAMLILERTTKKRIAFFFIISLLSSVQGFIPAVFAAYAVSLLLITGIVILMHRFEKKILRAVFVIWACVVSANTYWLAPVGYFALTQSKDYINAYNNITSTPQFIAKSIQYGAPPETALLKSFLWDSNELGGAILSPWRDHLAIPGISAIGYLFFGLAIGGLLYSITVTRKPLSWGLVVSLLYFFGNIAIDTPPFSWIIHVIQTHSPELVQAFRTTFTKFGIGLSFHYALFIAIGVYGLMRLLGKLTRHTAFHIVLPAIAAILLIIYALPLWQGNLVYRKMFVDLPVQYTGLIQYLNTLPDGKIADFPQDCSEGWYNQLWGYFGSGFLWYGVKQPIMARAFDVWSHTNENYFWELSTALRQQDYAAVERVFDKYAVRYILYDNNMTHCRSQKGFLSSLDFSAYLETSSLYIKQKSFTQENFLPITVYERAGYITPSVTVHKHAPNVLPAYAYNDLDVLFASTSSYISDPDKPADIVDTDRVRFSKRGTPLTTEELSALEPVLIASVSATSLDSVPCRETQDISLVARSARHDILRLMTTDAVACQKTTFTTINTNNAFVMALTSRHMTGEPLLVSVTNKGRPAGMDIQLPVHTALTTDYYFLPPAFPSEIELTVTVSNPSYNHYTSINELASIALYAVNSNQAPQTTGIQPSVPEMPKQVTHPASFLYIADLAPDQSSGILTINQSFDTGWLAFTEDRTQIKEHVLVNNWQNGWRLHDAKGRIFIVFLPQVLEYAGFVLFLLPGILILRAKT